MSVSIENYRAWWCLIDSQNMCQASSCCHKDDNTVIRLDNFQRHFDVTHK